MPPRINSPAWTTRTVSRSRGSARGGGEPELEGLRAEFLPEGARVEEAMLEPAPTTRGEGGAPGALDLSYDIGPNDAAVLAVRHPSGALTLHRPVQTTSRGAGGGQVRFQIEVRRRATRGIVGAAIKAILVKVGKVVVDKAVSFVLPLLAERFERGLWERKGLEEGWFKVTKETLDPKKKLERGTPVVAARSLLLIHGTFSDAASAYCGLANSDFFKLVEATYGDRIFAFNHFTVSRTPEQNARMLLEALPDKTIPFDVVTHSRGGLVLRNLVERAKAFGPLARRFELGHAVLVACPNDGTPLATPSRWEDTVGWMANLLEMFPDNPFTSGPAFVANGLVWIANHASGDLPGLHSMDRDGDMIAAIQGPPGPPPDAYSALVSNYEPTGAVLGRLVDAGVDGFFGSANDLVVPSEGGWRIDRSGTVFVPGARIGCFGPGGNLGVDDVTHVDFFGRAETTTFVANALLGRRQPSEAVDPRRTLPDRRTVGASRGAGELRARPRRGQARPAPAQAPLEIAVHNANLMFEKEALLLGHYRSSRLTGTEELVDGLIGGAMARSMSIGLYPSSIGSHQVFTNTRNDEEAGVPRPKAVIVAGLGDEGELKTEELVRTVRQAVLGWAQHLSDGATEGRSPEPFALAATLLGSGGTGMTAGRAARLIAQGVAEANTKIADQADQPDGRWPRVKSLRLIELYLDRATEAWNALRAQAAAAPDRFKVNDEVTSGNGGLKQPPDRGYRGAGYDYVTIETTRNAQDEPLISFTLDTTRARSEVRGQRAQSQLLKELVSSAADDRSRDQLIGRTLFNLLIPPELEPYLAGTGELQMELDSGTAGIPWELLDVDLGGEQNPTPWAIRVKLLRKLRTIDFRERVVDANADASVLVIGEPAPSANYPRLYGARNEAIAVRDCLKGPDGLAEDLVVSLISDDPSRLGPDAKTVVNAVFERPWRIVHIAGHGAEPTEGKPGGVVLSNDSVLGPGEIGNMRTVPELVFVNCCHLASGNPDELLWAPRFDRAAFAASVAEALIRIGVRCVIAAGWAVDDDAAGVFAKAFYGALLGGSRFIDAVGTARDAAYEANSEVNTWAAYQCYGDPDWTFRRQAGDANRYTTDRPDFSHVASPPALETELERVAVESRFERADPARQLEKLRALEEQFSGKWGERGRVAELFGSAFVEAGAVEKGIAWYERAAQAKDGGASMKATEQLANARARRAWELVDAAQRGREEVIRAAAAATTRKDRAEAARAKALADRALADAGKKAEELLASASDLLEKVLALEPTMERLSLVGSVFKRRALVEAAVNGRSSSRTMSRMVSSYEDARKRGAKDPAVDPFYPELNCLIAAVARNAGEPGRSRPKRAAFQSIRKRLDAKKANEVDFWTDVGKIELSQYEATAASKLASRQAALLRSYDGLYRRVKAPRLWASVYDTACLVLPNYARRLARTKPREAAAANVLLARVRAFAHPETGT